MDFTYSKKAKFRYYPALSISLILMILGIWIGNEFKDKFLFIAFWSVIFSYGLLLEIKWRSRLFDKMLVTETSLSTFKKGRPTVEIKWSEIKVVDETLDVLSRNLEMIKIKNEDKEIIVDRRISNFEELQKIIKERRNAEDV